MARCSISSIGVFPTRPEQSDQLFIHQAKNIRHESTKPGNMGLGEAHLAKVRGSFNTMKITPEHLYRA